VRGLGADGAAQGALGRPGGRVLMQVATPIRVEHVSHFYGSGALRRQILHEVSVELRAGEIVIVSGPSGSGKTTLLTLIGALRSAQEGSLQVLDVERAARARVSSTGCAGRSATSSRRTICSAR
jgi:ABC-type polar amino acid transport system ATPase subunit